MQRILIIEDNELNLELVTTLLNMHNIDHYSTSQAETGIELARRDHPDLILMDLSLPGMDGLTATGILKNDPATQAIPIVALTGHAMEGDREKALAAGCDGYISKPLQVRTFVQELRAIYGAATSAASRPT